MKRILIDTHIVDYINDDKELKEKLREQIDKGEVKLLLTHVQRDEIEDMGEDKKATRTELLALLDELKMELIPTKGAIFDISRFDMATFDDSDDIDKLRDSKREENPSRDALIFNTATSRDVDLFITDDKQRRDKLREVKPEVDVKSFAEFRQMIMNDAGNAYVP